MPPVLRMPLYMTQVLAVDDESCLADLRRYVI